MAADGVRVNLRHKSDQMAIRENPMVVQSVSEDIIGFYVRKDCIPDIE